MMHLDDTVIKSLTSNELNILKYIYGHPKEVMEMSVQELARQVSYSAATILRFCKKLGFSGFTELRYALRQIQQDTRQRSMASQKYSFRTQFLLDELTADIEGTANLIQDEQLEQTFRYLDSGCPIYLWSPGGTASILAGYLENLLFSIGRQKVYSIDPSKMREHILRRIHSDALLVLISAADDPPATVKFAKLAQINGIPILAITPYASNTIASLATVSFRFFTSLHEDKEASSASCLPVFYVIHLIVLTYLRHKQTIGALPDQMAVKAKAASKPAAAMDKAFAPASSSPILPLFLRARQLTLTDTEKELLRYLEDNLPSSAFIRLKDLSATLYTSNATIVRFCQKLGLKGYSGLKYQLRSELEQVKQTTSSFNSLISQSVAQIKEDLAGVDMALLGPVASLLTEDRPIYIAGCGSSSIAADHLHALLAALGYPSVLIHWPPLLHDLAYGFDSDSVLFIITTHGDAGRYLSALQRASQQGAAAILLTCGQDSPLLPYSTYKLCTNDQDRPYPHADNRILGFLTVIQLLIQVVAWKGDVG